MPNLTFKTAGGHYFWEDLEEFQGWRIQRNRIFGNCRLLNPKNERKGWWLDQEALTSAFRDLTSAFRDFVKSTSGNEYRSYQSEEINETYDLGV